MTTAERVAALPVGQICELLTRVVGGVATYGAHPAIVAVLAERGLLEMEGEPAPRPTLALVGEEPAPAVRVEPEPAAVVAAPGGGPSPLARILATPLPGFRANIRRVDRTDRAAMIRSLFKHLGLKGISVTTPSYSMASGNKVTIPPAAEHDRDRPSGHENVTCPHCREHVAARRHVRALILAAFPDLDDRSDYQSDYHDNPLSID